MRYVRNLRQFCMIIAALALLPGLVEAGLASKTLREVKLTSRALDVTVSLDGKLVFTLTPGEILVYSVEEDAVIDRIAIDAGYTRITYSENNRLVLTAPEPATLRILAYDRVHDINITNRPFRGPRDASVTLVVFDDYQ